MYKKRKLYENFNETTFRTKQRDTTEAHSPTNEQIRLGNINKKKF